MATKKFISLDKLQEYDILIKQKIAEEVDTKADSSHNHNNVYYTKTETDETINLLENQVAFIDAEDNEDVTDVNSGNANIVVDSALSSISTNPVQNKIITEEVYKINQTVNEHINNHPSSEQMQADWLQNDVTAKDYVKNRTHFSNIEYGNNQIANVVNIELIDGVGTLSDCGEIEAGLYYNVTVHPSASVGITTVGEFILATPYVEEGIECGIQLANEKFVLTVIHDEYAEMVGAKCVIYYNDTSVTKVDIVIYDTVENVVPLDEKYIPDSIARKTDIPVSVGGNGESIDSYVLTEAERVANNVLSVRNAYSFVTAHVSDLHTDGTGQTAISVLHAGQAIDEINKITRLDLFSIHGDVIANKFSDEYKPVLNYVRRCFSEVTKTTPSIQMSGNYEELSTDTTEEARQKYYAYIGANNVGTVTDWNNKFRNYGYRDFEDQKKRIIYLNTCDVSENEVSNDCYVSSSQLEWLANTALDFSDKSTDAENWTFSVYSHHPLNWYGNVTNVLTVLDAYKGKTSGNITLDGKTISYDFTNAVVKFIAHYHGHLHNFRVDRLGENGVLTITVPNVCFNRNNEYGTSTSYTDEMHEKYGDANADGTQRQFNKTANSEKDTAFNIIVEDILNEKIYCFNYGAGIDRIINFVEVEPDTPSNTYTNIISTAQVNTNGDSSILDGVGYRDGYYHSSAGGVGGAASGYTCTGLIPFERKSNGLFPKIYVKGVEWEATSQCRFYFYNSSKQIMNPSSYGGTGASSANIDKYMTRTKLGDNYWCWEATDALLNDDVRYSIKYFGFSAKGSGANLIVTLDEPIV